MHSKHFGSGIVSGAELSATELRSVRVCDFNLLAALQIIAKKSAVFLKSREVGMSLGGRGLEPGVGTRGRVDLALLARKTAPSAIILDCVVMKATDAFTEALNVNGDTTRVAPHELSLLT